MSYITNISEFFSFNYSSLFTSNSPSDNLFRLFIHPIVPFGAVAFYLLFSNRIFNFIRVTFALEPKGSVIQSITILHSLLLAVYSLWTFVNGARLFVPRIMEVGFYNAICDVDNVLWGENDLAFWVTHFYLSKFYEFIDTW
jgi:hypothetical protein